MSRAEPPAANGEAAPDRRVVESALRRLGFSPVREDARREWSGPSFWVERPGERRTRVGVYLDLPSGPSDHGVWGDRPSIVVVGSEQAAASAWDRVRRAPSGRLDADVAILVVPPARTGPPRGHWHTGVVDRRELLTLATGVLVGLVRRAAGSGAEGAGLDFKEMLDRLREQFHVDLERTLRVSSDEEVLWIMYQLALRHSYAPGDPGSNLHLLTLKPSGPAARLPWFAA